jgi:anti-sigma factor RsiW
MKCERYRDEIEEWLDGELAADERSALERHLNACPGCAQYLSRRRSLGVALKKTLRDLGSGLHFQTRPISRRPAAERPAWRRPWLRFAPRALTALAAVLIVALLFLFRPWAKPRPVAAPGSLPTAEITVSDSLNITDEEIITGCTSGICYSIDLQISTFEINDLS